MTIISRAPPLADVPFLGVVDQAAEVFFAVLQQPRPLGLVQAERLFPPGPVVLGRSALTVGADALGADHLPASDRAPSRSAPFRGGRAEGRLSSPAFLRRVGANVQGEGRDLKGFGTPRFDLTVPQGVPHGPF
ncbi:MAG TPA: hypothetical protein VGI17_09145 [Solirubrobacterales bacterium]|jgi:hypothetical protein